MKTTFTFFFIVICVLLNSVAAQSPYHKMLGADNSWYISGYYYVVGVESAAKPAGSLGTAGQGEYRARFDSTVNAKTYKIFVHSPGSYATLGPTMISCLIREDTLTQRVYVIPKDSTVERVVLDFSMNVADSIFLTYPNGNSILSSGYYKVDSVRYRTITAGSRKHLYLTNRNSPLNYVTGKRFFIEWIESVGAVHFPVNIIDQVPGSSGWKANPNWMLACGKQQLGSFVSCKLTNAVKIYHDSCSYNFAVQNFGASIKSKSTCDYYVFYFVSGIEESNLKNDLKIFPQPVSAELNIQIEKDVVNLLSLQVLSITGQALLPQYLVEHNKIKCDVRDLDPGIYLLVIKMADGTYSTGRFTKE